MASRLTRSERGDTSQGIYEEPVLGSRWVAWNEGMFQSLDRPEGKGEDRDPVRRRSLRILRCGGRKRRGCPVRWRQARGAMPGRPYITGACPWTLLVGAPFEVGLARLNPVGDDGSRSALAYGIGHGFPQ